MRKLFYKLFIYFLLLSIVLAGMFFLTGKLTANHRLGTTHLKQKRLASIHGNKMVLLGGSSLHYGMNSELLEKELGMKVVNMGIQGSIGMGYYFSEIMGKLKKGDVVVFLAEPAHFYKIDKDGEQTLYNLVSKYPQGISHLNSNQLKKTPQHSVVTIQENISYVLTLLAMKVKKKKTLLENTNEWGDYEGHKGKTAVYSPKPINHSLRMEDIEKNVDRAMSYLQEVEKEIKSRGAYFFIGFAPTAKSAEEPDVFQLIDQKVSDVFPKGKLGTMSEYVFPDDFFYDTSHHLLYDKRDDRTHLVVKHLVNNEAAGKLMQKNED